MTCRKLRWICQEHSNDVVRQVRIPGKSTLFVERQIYFVARHDLEFHVALEVRSYNDCKPGRCDAAIGAF